MTALTCLGHEESLLCQIILEPELLDDPRITSALFTGTETRALFKVMGQTKAMNAPITVFELGRRSENRGYAAMIENREWSAANADYHITSLCDLAKKRALADIAAHINNLIRDGADNEAIEAEIRAKLEAADGIGVSGDTIRSMDAVMKSTLALIKEAYRNKGSPQGILAGIPGLDRLTQGWQAGEMTTIGARPSVGKTALLLHFAMAAARAGRKVLFFSAEMGDELIGLRAVQAGAGIDSLRLRSGFYGASDLSHIESTVSELRLLPIRLETTPNISLRSFLATARRHHRREGTDLILIDYLQLVTHDDRRLPRYEQVSEISRSLKVLARELRVPLIAGCQLNREAEGQRPTLGRY